MKILMLLLSFSTISVLAQVDDIPFENNKVLYKEVIKLPGTDTVELGERAEHYLKTALNIEPFIATSNGFKAKGHSDFYSGKKKLRTKMIYDLIFELKDGKYRVIMTNIKFRLYPDNYNPQPFTRTAEKLRLEYMESSRKRSKHAFYQLSYFKSCQIAFDNRMNEIKEVMRKSVPQTQDDW